MLERGNFDDAIVDAILLVKKKHIISNLSHVSDFDTNTSITVGCKSLQFAYAIMNEARLLDKDCVQKDLLKFYLHVTLERVCNGASHNSLK